MEQSSGLANPQVTPSSEELAYLAGILDGEGSFGLNKMKRPKPPGFKLFLYLDICNTNAEILDACQEIFLKLGVNVWVQNKGIPAFGRREVFNLRMGAQSKIRRVLEAVLPYLRGKRAQARILLRYISRRDERGVGRGHPLNDDDLAYYRELRELNRRGTSETTRSASDSTG